jgi:cyclopropane fatty-acyl-phospholipid synthase-like methyltransferase
LCQALAISENDRVLEIGCGVARIGREVAQQAASWHGVDISSTMLQLAAKRTAHLPNVGLSHVEGSADTGLPDQSFTRVYSHIVFIHMDKEDLFNYLREAHRLLEPLGLMYFDTWNLAHPEGWARFIDEVEHYPTKEHRPVHRGQWSTAQEIRLYCEHAGLEILYLLDDTFWIQVIATKLPDSPSSADAEHVDKLRAHVAQHLDILHPEGDCTW